MFVLFSLDNQIFKWNKTLEDKIIDFKSPLIKVDISDPLTVEYKRIHVISDNFDKYSKSEIMVVNHIRNKQTKERALEQVTYYDNDVNITKDRNNVKKWSIGAFDPGEYGNPVCFHTPGYQGTVILITTKVWEINSPALPIKIIKSMQNLLSLGSSQLPYLELANTSLGITSKIINGTIKHKSLASDHVLELRIDSNKPIYVGKYICFPELKNINERNDILENYYLDDNMLVKDENGVIVEYNNTYFILEISNVTRDDLSDFDFMASSVELLNLIHSSGVQDITDDILQVNRDSYDLNIIKKIEEEYNSWLETGDSVWLKGASALFKQLDWPMREILTNKYEDLEKNVKL